MNADRIIVIDDGTILESGDHETLIRSGGKYASLWSKQIFLKPKNGKQASESTTPSTLINDLEPETAEAEMVKLQAAIKDAEERAGNGKTTEGGKTSEGRGSEVDSSGESSSSSDDSNLQ